MPSQIFTFQYKSPIGTYLLANKDNFLVMCRLLGTFDTQDLINILERKYKCRVCDSSTPLLLQAASELDEYFKGQRRVFNVPLNLQVSAFAQNVLARVKTIDYGCLCTYAELSEAVADRRYTRACAGALKHNLITIFIPCHRVVGTNCAITGYNGGIEAKKYLLNLEKNNLCLNQ